MKTSRGIFAATVAGLALTIAAPMLRAEQKEQRAQLSERDYKFVTEAARGGMMEVQLGELARQKAVNPAVRTFGERMAADHSKANDELKQIASRKGAGVPAALTHHENAEMEHLQKASGRDFDERYAREMVKDHKKDLKEFQDAAKDLADSDLRSFANNTVSTIKEHLRMAEDMEKTVRSEK